MRCSLQGTTNPAHSIVVALRSDHKSSTVAAALSLWPGSMLSPDSRAWPAEAIRGADEHVRGTAEGGCAGCESLPGSHGRPCPGLAGSAERAQRSGSSTDQAEQAARHSRHQGVPPLLCHVPRRLLAQYALGLCAQCKAAVLRSASVMPGDARCQALWPFTSFCGCPPAGQNVTSHRPSMHSTRVA